MAMKTGSVTPLPSGNKKGAPIASPGHQSVTGNKMGSKMPVKDLRSAGSKR